jgi:hypothetical protein
VRHQVAGGGGSAAVQDGIDGIVEDVTLQLLQFKKHFGVGLCNGEMELLHCNCYAGRFQP